MSEVEQKVTSTYKSESARLLAVLTRIFGPQNLEMAEDVLQEAFQKALVQWKKSGIPANPSAWIINVAKNQAIDIIRANKTKTKFSNDLSQLLESEWSLGNTIEQEFQDSKIKDDQLRMIFMCCHESIKAENQIPFILKNLCGFSIPAIARALVIPVATVKKRLLRTKEKLKEHMFDFPELDKLDSAMDTVHTVFYLLFNEGFHSSDGKQALKVDFCHEAMGLVNLLADEPRIVNQDTLGLFALMHYHFARIESRLDRDGFNIPIDLQDRSLWKRNYIGTGNYLIKLAGDIKPGATGRFFIEALIANEHCNAESFSQTNWKAIVGYYDLLTEITNSPVARLNHAIAVGYAGDVDRGISIAEALKSHKTLKNSHMPSAVLAHLNAMAGNRQSALENAEAAKKLGGTPHEQKLMTEQIERLLGK